MRSPHRRGYHLLVEAAAQFETRHKTSHASHYRIAGSAADSPLGASRWRIAFGPASTCLLAYSLRGFDASVGVRLLRHG